MLRAPAAGTIILRTVEEGDTVQPGRTLLVLSKPGRTEIIAPVDEKNLALLEVGQQAVVSPDAYPERTFSAVLETLVPAIVAASGTETVKFAVPEPPAYRSASGCGARPALKFSRASRRETRSSRRPRAASPTATKFA